MVYIIIIINGGGHVKDQLLNYFIQINNLISVCLAFFVQNRGSIVLSAQHKTYFGFLQCVL